jgi:hypothetical protein
MKKIFASLFVLATLVAFTSNSAKAQAFEQGKIYVNAGLGLKSGVTWIYGTGEYALNNTIGLGAGVDIVSISFLGQSASTTSFSVRGAYHFGEIVNVEKLDLYGAAQLDLNNGNTLYIAPGARYFFSDKFGINSELGIALTNGGGSVLKVGLAIKF